MAEVAPDSKNLVVDWAPVNAEGNKPSPRGGHSAVAVGSSIVVFGGHGYNGKFEYYNDTHIFDGDTGTWHNVRCSGVLPEPRYGHSVVVVGNRMFLFGGKGQGTIFRDVHFLDLEEWAWVPVSSTSTGPSPR
jgi:N-acetylneuraminic acid mutarotase